MQLERMKKTVMFEREQRRVLILEFETYAKNMQDVFEQMETSKQVCVCVYTTQLQYSACPYTRYVCGNGHREQKKEKNKPLVKN